MSAAASFSQADIDAATAQLATLRQTSPDILFVIARSKNANIVVYEALRGADGKLDPAKPIGVYWLDIDPAYQQAARKKGIQSDRNELNALEKQFAYGLSFEPVAGGAAGRYHVKLVALPERPVTMYLDADGKLHGQIAVNGQQVDLVRIFVHSVDRTLRPPKVEYIDLVGKDANGAYVHERIIPK